MTWCSQINVHRFQAHVFAEFRDYCSIWGWRTNLFSFVRILVEILKHESVKTNNRFKVRTRMFQLFKYKCPFSLDVHHLFSYLQSMLTASRTWSRHLHHSSNVEGGGSESSTPIGYLFKSAKKKLNPWGRFGWRQRDACVGGGWRGKPQTQVGHPREIRQNNATTERMKGN